MAVPLIATHAPTPLIGLPPAAASASNAPAGPATATPAQPTAADKSTDDDGFSFGDLLDMINPLQHIPVVSTLYRAITGDRIGDASRLVGDAIYGGPIGLLSSAANIAFEHITGKDFGDTALAMLGIGDSDEAAVAQPSTAVASTAVGVTSAANSSTTATPPADVAPAQIVTLDQASLDALMAAVNSNGIDADLGQRAISAYRKTLGSPDPSAAPAQN